MSFDGLGDQAEAHGVGVLALVHALHLAVAALVRVRALVLADAPAGAADLDRLGQRALAVADDHHRGRLGDEAAGRVAVGARVAHLDPQQLDLRVAVGVDQCVLLPAAAVVLELGGLPGGGGQGECRDHGGEDQAESSHARDARSTRPHRQGQKDSKPAVGPRPATASGKVSALPSDHVRAAGGVVLRGGKVCIIHRPDYEDWSLPKGKLDGRETHEQAALREVYEETGLRCTLGAELSSQEYTDRRGRPKAVRWWAMSVVCDDGFKPLHEVDERRWVTPEQAERVLVYEHDRELVREAVAAQTV